MAEYDRHQDPATHREAFRRLFGGHARGSFERRNEDGSLTTIRAYEVMVEPMTERGLLTVFGLRAAAAGYKQAIGPVVLPEIGFADSHGTRPLTSVQFFLEENQLTPPDRQPELPL